MAKHLYPYSNFHDLNLDWILEIVQKAQNTLSEFQNQIVQETGDGTNVVMSQKSVTDNLNQLQESINQLNGYITNIQEELNTKVNKTQILQTAGTSTTDTMSQNAITNALTDRGILDTYSTGAFTAGDKEFTLPDMVPGTVAYIVVECSETTILGSLQIKANGVLVPYNYINSMTVNASYTVDTSATVFNFDMNSAPANVNIKIIYTSSSQNYLTTKDVVQTVGNNTDKIMSQNITTTVLDSKLPLSNVVSWGYTNNQVISALAFAIRNLPFLYSYSYPIISYDKNNLTINIINSKVMLPNGNPLYMADKTLTVSRSTTQMIYYDSTSSELKAISLQNLSTLTETCIPIAIVPSTSTEEVIIINGGFKIDNVTYLNHNNIRCPNSIRPVLIPLAVQTLGNGTDDQWQVDLDYPNSAGYYMEIDVAGVYPTSTNYKHVYALVSSPTLDGLQSLTTEISTTSTNAHIRIRHYGGTSPGATAHQCNIILFLL